MSASLGVVTRARSRLASRVVVKPENPEGIEPAPSSAQRKPPASKNITKKRKRGATSDKPRKKPTNIDLTVDQEEAASFQKEEKAKIDQDEEKAEAIQEEENSEPVIEYPDDGKRPRPFRKWAPKSYIERLDRATSQRMFVIERTRGGTDAVPDEKVELAGSTGNIYLIHICERPECTCPDNKKGNQCKHIVYVLHNVLKAPEHLEYQLAFLPSELRLIFTLAPPIPSATGSATSSSNSSNRKEISGDCPVCFTEFEPETDEIVWCKAACGNNVHKTCFEQWAKSRTGDVGIRCVYCRTPWQDDEDSVAKVKASGKRGPEGYVNVGNQLGLATRRDTSSYHHPWVRQQYRRKGGYIF